jgi:hypothetical protein
MPKRKVVVYLDNEREVLDVLINYGPNDWNKAKEFSLLRDHFKSGGGLKDVEYFYNNIEKICNWRGTSGCDLVYIYCRNVLKGRLPFEVEKKAFAIIWKNWRSSKVGYKYSKYVVRGKLEGLDQGCKSFDYIKYLAEKKLEFIDVLLGSSEMSYYFYRNMCYLPDVVHNFMIANNMGGDRWSRIYFKQRKKDDYVLKNRLSLVDGSKTIREYLENL